MALQPFGGLMRLNQQRHRDGQGKGRDDAHDLTLAIGD